MINLVIKWTKDKLLFPWTNKVKLIYSFNSFNKQIQLYLLLFTDNNYSTTLDYLYDVFINLFKLNNFGCVDC